MARLRAGHEFGVPIEYEEFGGIDEYVEFGAERDLVTPCNCATRSMPPSSVDVKIRFRAAQLGEFEPARHRDRARRTRLKPQMPCRMPMRQVEPSAAPSLTGTSMPIGRCAMPSAVTRS